MGCTAKAHVATAAGSSTLRCIAQVHCDLLSNVCFDQAVLLQGLWDTG